MASNHLVPLVFFYTPCKHQKTTGFLVIVGGIEQEPSHAMDSVIITFLSSTIHRDTYTVGIVWMHKHRVNVMRPL